MSRIQLLFTLVATLLLSACGSTPARDNSALLEATAKGAIVQPVTIDGALDGTEIDPNSIAGKAPLERVIYFDYDTAELRPEFLDIVAQHGRFLAQNP